MAPNSRWQLLEQLPKELPEKNQNIFRRISFLASFWRSDC
jgi:hypothetical protein